MKAAKGIQIVYFSNFTNLISMVSDQLFA